MTVLLTINISLHYFQIKREFEIAVSFGKNKWLLTYILSFFKGAVFRAKGFVASKTAYVTEKCSGLNHLLLSSQQIFFTWKIFIN